MARAYFERIEQLLGVPLSIISVGPGREETPDPARALRLTPARRPGVEPWDVATDSGFSWRFF